MIKVLEQSTRNTLLYTCVAGDTLECIANKFGITTSDILRDNPLFSSVYPGCVLYLTNLGKKRVIVAPLETLDDIAKRYNVTVDEIMKTNNLVTRKVFVGMQLLIDKKGE